MIKRTVLSTGSNVLSLCVLILLFFNISVVAQNNDGDYDKQWIKAEAFMKKSLPKSALEMVEQIYSSALKENNQPQQVKCILYKIELLGQIEEDSEEKAIAMVLKEIQSASFPATAIYHSIVADLYFRYYSSHRYQWLQRTVTEKVLSDDIKTWDIKKLMDQVIFHHLEALKNSGELKKIKRDSYQVLLQEDIFNSIEERKDAAQARPTLFDFLSHRAVDMFVNEESSLPKPADQFLLDDPAYLSMYQDFINLPIHTADTMSLRFYALRLFQDLIAFHQTDQDLTALIDVDLKRLSFVNQQSVIEGKNELYLKTLENLQQKLNAFPASADVAFHRARHLSSTAGEYKPLESEDHKFDNIKALEICDDINKKHPGTKGARNCKLLAAQIKEMNMTFVMDDVVVPDKPVLGLLTYENITRLYWRIIAIDPQKDKEIRQSYDSKKQLREYLSMATVLSGIMDLPDDRDYNSHKVQLSFPAMQAGYYILLLSPGEHFRIDEYSISSIAFWASNISYISRKNTNGEEEIYVLDRQQGKAMKNVTVECWTSDYDYKSRKRAERLWRSLVTDKEGYVKISAREENSSRSFYLVLKSGKERLISGEYFYLSNYISKPDKKRESTFIFTDRAIYRPGQTIYYKGIMLYGEGNDLQVRPKFNTHVALYDVNERLIAENNVVTNDYGSFSGTFTAPSGTLTGRMRISNEYGSRDINVEEYKRPRFEAKFQPVENEYTLNSKVTVRGKASTYAGNPVDGAKVSYRVKRTARYPYWFDFWRIMPGSAGQEIVNGTTLTNEKGEYLITFQTLPDKTIDKSHKPVFRYEIIADVTDLNGEVRSASTFLSASYASFILSSDLADEVNTKITDKVLVSAKNLSGKNVNVEVEVTISMLKQPVSIYRSRKWDRPDKFMMTEESFHKIYPYDIYDDEMNKTKWDISSVKVKQKLRLPADSLLKINDISNWSAGDYKIEVASKDKSGELLKYQKFFTLFTPGKKAIPGSVMHWLSLTSLPVEPGNKVTAYYGSKAKDVNVLYEIMKGNEIIQRKWLQLSEEMLSLPVDVIEDYRGDIGVCFTFIKDNRYYQAVKPVRVPFSNKELEVSFETFRDRLQPGQKEEWKLKISGNNKEKVAAELLLGMYDASLDAFAANTWPMKLYFTHEYRNPWKCQDVFSLQHSNQSYFHRTNLTEGYYFRKYDRMIYDRESYGYVVQEALMSDDTKGGRGGKSMVAREDVKYIAPQNAKVAGVAADDAEPAGKGDAGSAEVISPTVPLSPVRTDLRETAFFYPDLQTDKEGNIYVKFTLPESLTLWKVMGLAHTAKLETASFSRELRAQKDLMVFPNPPRFLREGDRVTFSTKISSLSTIELKGKALLELFDAVSMQDISSRLLKEQSTEFALAPGGSTSVSWTFVVPHDYQAITWRVTARAGDFSDGEESTLPVLSNRTLVTETLPLPVRGKGSFTFNLLKLSEQSIKKSPSLINHQLSLEFTQNPAWYAVQSLPYLMEFPYECSEQLFNRYYANQIASFIANHDPGIRKVFESWSQYSPSALQSALEKNQDLKSLVLEETPWVMQAKDEKERKQRVGLLFDLNRMANEATSNLNRLNQMQTPNGGWPWFQGMPDDRYITQYILSGYGHMLKLGIFKEGEEASAAQMIAKGVKYTDERINEDYREMLKTSFRSVQDNNLNHSVIQYLYMRSFFLNTVDIDPAIQEAFDYYKGQARSYWTSQNPYLQGMIALALYRMGELKAPGEIMRSLTERSMRHPEFGMYWKENSSGYYWHQQNIAAQALLIEAYDEVSNDSLSVEELKIWLLKQKQTQDWRTTTATADACYALLLKGADLLEGDNRVEISVGDRVFKPGDDPSLKAEAGTGYFRYNWQGEQITPSLSKVTVNKQNSGIAWGALYWQYFEDLDKVTPSNGAVKIDRQLFIKKNTASGPVLVKVDVKNHIHTGDKVVVRISFTTDRDMEYVHLKDHRASGMEAVDVLSGYHYQDGVGYYQSTKDAATHFFFSWLPKGTRIFEYSLNASMKGEFSQGLTSVECMYAPEFSAHSEGIRINIE